MKETNEIIYTCGDVYTATEMTPTQIVIDIIDSCSFLDVYDRKLTVGTHGPDYYFEREICSMGRCFVLKFGNVIDIVVSEDGKEAIIYLDENFY